MQTANRGRPVSGMRQSQAGARLGGFRRSHVFWSARPPPLMLPIGRKTRGRRERLSPPGSRSGLSGFRAEDSGGAETPTP
jgi:hypothetical protein